MAPPTPRLPVITTLALRHLRVRKLRSLFLLVGFSLGVGVMIVLLSVGQAMLEQSRDTSLVGGGEVTILPEGIDVEAMRTGGLGGMFFGIDRARFLVRQMLGGERQASMVRAVSPAIEGKLLYLRSGNRTVAVRASGEVPSRAHSVGSGLEILTGRWEDSPADSSYVAPSRQQLYDDLDRFHLPVKGDPSWGEWHYFNLIAGPKEWWYITYLVGGKGPMGQLLVTRRLPDGAYQRYSARIPASRVVFDTGGADVTLGTNSVRQREGKYHLQAAAPGSSGTLRIGLTITPLANRYFPPIELRDGDFVSGYVVPALGATASGDICIAQRCREFTDIPAYHDHNWGIWRDVTWEWGAARGSRLNLLYGGVYAPDQANRTTAAASSPFFLAIVDSLGVKQVLRFNRVQYRGSRPVPGGKATSPEGFGIIATRDADTLRMDVRVADALATEMGSAGLRRDFLQMRGRFTAFGRVLGQTLADSGSGFFETYVRLRH